MKTCAHKQKRDQDSTYCHSCYMAGWRAKNKEYATAYQRAYNRRKRKEKPKLVAAQQRRWRIKQKYGLTVEEYEAMFTDATCGICDGNSKLVLDHCHETGEIRGVLCTRCNVALGSFGDNIIGVQRVLGYLNGDM